MKNYVCAGVGVCQKKSYAPSHQTTFVAITMKTAMMHISSTKNDGVLMMKESGGSRNRLGEANHQARVNTQLIDIRRLGINLALLTADFISINRA